SAGRPTWSPDGAKFAFSAARTLAGEPCQPLQDLLVTSAEGGAETRVTADPFVEFDPTWSPTGDWIAYRKDFLAFDPEEGCEPISVGGGTFLIRPDGSQDRQVDYRGEHMDGSPDRKYIASDLYGDIFVTRFTELVESSTNLTNTPLEPE